MSKFDFTKIPIREYQSIAHQWDTLSGTLTNHHPLFDSSFVGPLIAHFSNEADSLVTVSKNQVPVAYLPVTQQGFGIRSWLPAQTQVSPMLISEKIPLFEMSGKLALSFDLMCQDPSFSPWLDPLLAEHPHSSLVHSTTMSIDLSGTFDDYWGQRSRNLRDNMKRKFKKPKKANLVVDMRVVTDPDEMREAVKSYGDLESAGWKAQQNTNVHIDNTQGQFYYEVLRNFAEKNQAAVYELYLNDQLGASKLTIANSDMIINLKKAYNESLSEYSPGRLLDYLQLTREFERKRFKVMEFYTNATRDQLSWSTDSRDITHYTLFRGKSIAFANTVRASAKKLMGKR